MRRPDRLRRGSGREPVYQITGARRGVREDVDSRSRRYLVSMGIRTLCFVLAVVTHGWLRWAFVGLALILPYMAVVLANTGRDRNVEIPATDLADDRRALGPTDR